MTQDAAPFTRPLTAQEAALAQLRKEIVSGELGPGSPIRQEAIAERFGVSRVPVREALKILEGEGQVLYRPHKGYLVAQLDFSEVQEIYYIRRLLEEEALRLAVPRLTDDDVESLADLAAQLEQTSSADIERMASLNRRFHFGFFEPSGMPRLVKQIRLLWDSSDAYRAIYYMDQARHTTVHEEHRELVEAARDRDLDRIIEVFAIHRQNALDHLETVLETQAGDDVAGE